MQSANTSHRLWTNDELLEQPRPDDRWTADVDNRHRLSPASRSPGSPREVAAPETGHEVLQDVAFTCAERRLRRCAIPSVKRSRICRLKSARGCAPTTAARCSSVIRGSRCPAHPARPTGDSAISGAMCSGISGAVCSAIPVHTRIAASSAMPWPSRNLRASSAPSISKRWSERRSLGQPEVVEHRADVKQLGVIAQACSRPRSAPKQVDPPLGVGGRSTARRLADELGSLGDERVSGSRCRRSGWHGPPGSEL